MRAVYGCAVRIFLIVARRIPMRRPARLDVRTTVPGRYVALPRLSATKPPVFRHAAIVLTTVPKFGKRA
jgi:hypothetical protein